MAVFYLDPINGNDANDGLTFANRWKSITNGATAARIAPGDTVRIIQSPSPTALGTCAYTNCSNTINIPAGLAKVLYTEGYTSWVASAGVTRQSQSSRMVGASCVRFDVADAFTTGKVAHLPLGSAIDLSNFRQLNLFLRSSLTIPAGTLTINLCSDTMGSIILDSLTLNQEIIGNGIFYRLVFEGATNFGSSIQSLSICLNTDLGAFEFRISNIFVTKPSSEPDGFNLYSLLSRAANTSELFGNVYENGLNYALMPIQNMQNDTTITIDCDRQRSNSTFAANYQGTTGDYTAYIWQPIIIPPLPTDTVFETLQESGTEGNLITYSGGWSSSDMSSQNHMTLIMNQNCFGYALSGNAKQYIKLEKLGFYGYRQALSINSNVSYSVYEDLCFGMCYEACINTSSSGNLYKNFHKNLYFAYTGASGFSFYNGSYNYLTFDNCAFISCEGSGTTNNSAGFCWKFNKCLSYGMADYGLNIVPNSFRDNPTFIDCKFANNQDGDVSFYDNLLAYNCILASSKQAYQAGTSAACYYNELRSWRHNQADNIDVIFAYGYKICKQNAITRSGTGYAWQIDVTSANRNAEYPVYLMLGGVYCRAGVQKTVTAYLRRSNTGLTLGLRVPGYLMTDGNEILSHMSADADYWQQVSIQFVPGNDGMIPLYVYTYGGDSFSGYVDDIGV